MTEWRLRQTGCQRREGREGGGERREEGEEQEGQKTERRETGEEGLAVRAGGVALGRASVCVVEKREGVN